jgi:hypothetical protein
MLRCAGHSAYSPVLHVFAKKTFADWVRRTFYKSLSSWLNMRMPLTGDGRVISIVFWSCPKCTYKDFRRTGSRRLLNRAIEFGVRASEISLDSRARWCKANLLSHLGSLFLRRSYQTRLYSDTSQGIRYIQLTFETTMERSRGRAVHL